MTENVSVFLRGQRTEMLVILFRKKNLLELKKSLTYAFRTIGSELIDCLMKKYIIKLMQEDLELVKKRLSFWETMRDELKVDPYQVNRKKSYLNKIKKIERFLERIEIEL